MIKVVTEQEPTPGYLYKFVYKNKVRVALCLDNKNNLMRAWDFTREDYRQFYHEKMGPVTDISNKMTVLDLVDTDEVQDYRDEGCLVYHDDKNDMAYCVRLKQGANA